LSGHILLSEFHFEKMLQHLKALTSPCFEGASVHRQRAQMGPPCSSFPWPNAQRWRNMLSCDVRLIHAAVFENFFCLETRRSSIWVAAARSQQTPGSSFHSPLGQLCGRAKEYRTSWRWAVSIRQASGASMEILPVWQRRQPNIPKP
jgi:hypothetical protein